MGHWGGVRLGGDPLTHEPITTIVEPLNPETTLDGQEAQELWDTKPENPLEGTNNMYPMLEPKTQVPAAANYIDHPWQPVTNERTSKNNKQNEDEAKG